MARFHVFFYGWITNLFPFIYWWALNGCHIWFIVNNSVIDTDMQSYLFKLFCFLWINTQSNAVAGLLVIQFLIFKKTSLKKYSFCNFVKSWYCLWKSFTIWLCVYLQQFFTNKKNGISNLKGTKVKAVPGTLKLPSCGWENQ